MSSSDPSKTLKQSSHLKKNEGTKNNKEKYKGTFNCFVLPPPVILPKFPIPKDLPPAIYKNLIPSPGMSQKTLKFIEILNNIKRMEKFETTESNHLQLLKLMLYVEEIQNQIEMQRFDQTTQLIKAKASSGFEFFKIYVDGLTEEKLSVRPDDIVEAHDLSSKILFRLKITNVMDDHIIAVGGKRFLKLYSPEKYYNIRFKYHNYTIRCCHYALFLINSYNLTPILFPESTRSHAYLKNHENVIWFNSAIKNNPEQAQAVINISAKSSKPAPYILYGPPGTGKTATLVEAICQIYHNDSSEKILVCTPSNAAADVITKRLLMMDIISENDIYRMYSPAKEGSWIDEAIVGCSNYVEGRIMMLPEAFVQEKRIVICTLCACIRLLFMHFKEKHFAYIFIDEAGQAIEPDSMIPFNLSSSTKEGRIGRLHGQVVIAGDPQQLGPGVRSKLAEPILGKSLLERLMNSKPYRKNEHDKYNPNFITKLLKNYRSHPKIIQVSNELFYENELQACGDEIIRKAEDWNHLVKKKFPVVFHGVEGLERKNPRSPSVYNIEELKVVVTYVKLLLDSKFKNGAIKQKDIGVITPFVEQKKKLKEALENNCYDAIEVGTVELFQGREKDIIILSTVRSKIFHNDGDDHIGFLSNQKRLNVALTRAKALLIVVGNPNALQIDEHWRYFLNFCKHNNTCRGKDFNLGPEFYNSSEINKPIDKSRNLPHYKILDTNLQIVDLDEGVYESSDSSMEDENPGPSTSVHSTLKKFNIQPAKVPVAYGIHKAPRSEAMLSDVVVKKMSDLKLEKLAAKKEKKKKKKSQNQDDLNL